MTTIATDGKTMAADGQADVADTIIASSRPKVLRLSDGSLFGMAGSGAQTPILAEWLEKGGPKPKLHELSALRLTPSGELFYINEACDPIAIEAPAAVGSGMQFALGAMEAGATPKQAVEIACRRDPFSGGTIKVHRL